MRSLFARLFLLRMAACGDVEHPAVASDDRAPVTQEKRQHAEGEHDCCDSDDHDHHEADCGHHHGHDD